METKKAITSRRPSFVLLTAFAAGLLATGCFVSPVMPPIGFIYHQGEVPVDIVYDETSIGTGTGTAESMSILGLVAMGDSRVSTAAENGNVAVVQHVDAELFNVLGVYQRYTTIVHGLTAGQAAAADTANDTVTVAIK